MVSTWMAMTVMVMAMAIWGTGTDVIMMATALMMVTLFSKP